MPPPEPLTTTLSTKGHVILPKAICHALRWQAGTRLVVERTSAGVLLRSAPAFTPTKHEDVFGCLAHQGPPPSIEDMNQAVLDEARRRHARD